jgi:hypothetical protein
MAPLIATSNLTITAALRKRIDASRPRELSKAFIAWLLEDFNNLLSIAGAAAKRAGAGQDFLDIAILGLAAHAGVLSEPGVAELKEGLTRLAGLRPIVNGVRMPLYTDAVGMLGVALGTAVIADAELTSQVVGWTRRFLKSAYEMDEVQDWQRCLLAAADLSLGSPLILPFPTSGLVADVRLALLAKGLINSPKTQVQLDTARLRQSTIEEPLGGPVECERAALCVAGVEWVIREAGNQAVPASASTEHIITNPPHTSKEAKRSDIDARPLKKRGRRAKIPDELKEQALRAQGAKERAQILYQCLYPTNQQKKNVSAILRHHRSKSAPN